MKPQGAALDRRSLPGATGDPDAGAAGLIGILDIVELPIVVLRRDLLIAWFNQAAAEELRLSPSDLGRAPGDVPALAGLPRLAEQCRQVVAGGVELCADLRDGDGWFVVRMSPYTRDGRHVAGIVLTFTNVTAFRACVDQAVYERECTKAILNAIADPLVVLSADQRVQSGNRAFYAMFGASRESTQWTTLYDLAGGAFELAPLREQLRGILTGGQAFQPLEVESVVTAKGPRTLILDAHPLSFPGLAERRVLLTFQDITARKQAEAAKDLRSEEELRRSESFLAEGQRLSSTGSFAWNPATDDITWSDQLYRIYEFEPGSPVTIERILSRVHPEDLSVMNESIERARAVGGDFDYAHRLLMPDGSVKYLNAMAHGSHDADGRWEYIGAVQDVTHHRMSEEALAKARSELATVARVTSLGALTASIAHEVNQPLLGIITNASTCLRMLAAEPPNVDGALETARRTIRDGNRASDVIKRLRALFSKGESEPRWVDLNETAREVIALTSSELRRNGVIVRTEFAKGLAPVLGDHVQLQQVILNLLLNASEAMNGVSDRPRRLVVRTAREEGDQVRLAVEDSGVGFHAEDADRLFEVFFTTKSGGMGIGLFVSRSIIESHRGRLRAAPNKGPGSTFSFSLPCRSERVAEGVNGSAAARDARNR